MSHLTARQWEVVYLLADGMTRKEIAEYLRIRPLTVRTHIFNIMRRLDIHREAEIIAWYYKTGRYKKKDVP